MESLNESVREYTAQLEKGHIQRAYRGIMNFMTALRKQLEAECLDYVAGGFYPGYMDMSYVSFTPAPLKEMGLKIAVVYLHRENRFDLWLAGGNRGIQSRYIARMGKMDLGDFSLSQPAPGVDSIVERILVENPDFDRPEALMRRIAEGLKEFAGKITTILATNDVPAGKE